MDWSTIEQGIQAWAAAGSGLPDGRVIWSLQSGDRPATPYIALRLTAVRVVGTDWNEAVDAASPTSGAEIEHRARGHRRALLEVQAHGGPAHGAGSAVALLERLQARSVLPTVRDALVDAGVGLGRFEGVTSLDGMVGDATLESRAAFEVPIFLASEVSEFGTYIEHVELENETTGESFEVP